jgi:hypothetical protein
MKFDPTTTAGSGPRSPRGTRIRDVAARLRDDAQNVARALLGEPNKRLSHKQELRWGNNGSLRVHINGDRKGSWIDESGGDPDRGDMLKLVVRERGGKEVGYEWARRWCGDTGDGEPPAPPPSTKERNGG